MTSECEPDENGVIVHSWKWVRDSIGDPGVINGTADCSHYECAICGAEEEGDPPTDDDCELSDNSWVLRTIP